MPRFFPAPARKVRGFFVLWLQPLDEPRHSPKGDGGFARPVSHILATTTHLDTASGFSCFCYYPTY